MNIYDGKLKFRGTFRRYQQRILDAADKHLEDQKIHIVAAPGSGKTTLGIELIRRLGSPCLIISPSLIIREQWLERIRESFLISEKDAPDILSDDIRKPAEITSITYQALYCGLNQCIDDAEEGETEEEEMQEAETADYTGFQFLKTIKEAGILVLCLDECHHLKQEWWKALEVLRKNMPELKVISLTATPPYDSSPAQWERYCSLCGPVDEEIVIPELVKEGSLCPHQDYVYFNYPAKEEEERVTQFYETAFSVVNKLMCDAGFAEIVSSHAGIQAEEPDSDKLLENPAYLSSILIFLNAKKIPFSDKLLRLLGVKQLPPMDEKWMEYLLQGFLYEDKESYTCSEEYRAVLVKELKSHQLIVKNKVGLTRNDSLENMLVKSKGKLNSIREIIQAEYWNMGGKLRGLILTDYIRKEYLPAIGYLQKELNEVGVVPVFEMLRRTMPRELALGILCGSLVVVPKHALYNLEMDNQGTHRTNSFSFTEFVDETGQYTGYVKVDTKGNRQELTSFVTGIFEAGYIHTLIGTKSLLGEGWDAPSVNTLVLASFVGSFVLSNQMRGRAIRTKKEEPEKTANIWHLVCLASKKQEREQLEMGMKNPSLTADFETLNRRMKGILGIHYEKNRIENGIERLGIQEQKLTKRTVPEINQRVLAQAGRRDVLRQRWGQTLDMAGEIEVTEHCFVPRKALNRKLMLGNMILYEMISFVTTCFSWLFRMNARLRLSYEGEILATMLGVGCLAMTMYFLGKILKLSTPIKRMKYVGEGVLRALQQKGEITSDVKIVTFSGTELCCEIYLMGGTIREKTLFRECLSQTCSAVDNQRYLLAGKIGRIRLDDYFCVPDYFGKSKEDARCFQKAMRASIGDYTLVYTRNEKGRRILLDARRKAFFNRNERAVTLKKEIKGALE